MEHSRFLYAAAFKITEIFIKKPPKIISAQVIVDRTLLIEFSQNEFKKYDISQLLNKEMFAPLRNPSFFKNFKIESGGYGLVWNEDIDISEYELWKNGVSLKDGESQQFLPMTIF